MQGPEGLAPAREGARASCLWCWYTTGGCPVSQKLGGGAREKGGHKHSGDRQEGCQGQGQLSQVYHRWFVPPIVVCAPVCAPVRQKLGGRGAGERGHKHSEIDNRRQLLRRGAVGGGPAADAPGVPEARPLRGAGGEKGGGSGWGGVGGVQKHETQGKHRHSPEVPVWDCQARLSPGPEEGAWRGTSISLPRVHQRCHCCETLTSVPYDILLEIIWQSGWLCRLKRQTRSGACRRNGMDGASIGAPACQPLTHQHPPSHPALSHTLTVTLLHTLSSSPLPCSQPTFPCNLPPPPPSPPIPAFPHLRCHRVC